MPSTRNRRSLTADRVLRLVTQEWQRTDDLMEQWIPLVPPGKALRKYALQAERNEADRQRRIDAGSKPIARRPPPSEAEQAQMGARIIVNDILGSARDSQTIEMRVDDEHGRQVRLSAERRYAHHCCLHGGTCKAEASEEEGPPEPGELRTAVDDLETLIAKVLQSRADRMPELPPPGHDYERPPYRWPDAPKRARDIDGAIREEMAWQR